MSYSLSLSGGGSSDGAPRRLAAGQLVTARFQPSGVNPSNTSVVTNALGAQMASIGAFKTPEYVGWGRDDNNGLIVFRAQMRTGQFTPAQVADKIKAVMPALEQALGAKRLTFLTIRHPTPSGETVPDVTPDTPVTPDAGGGGGGGDGGGGAQEEENFFTRKVGGVPVWAIGAGVLALGTGLVFVATRKKPASVAKNPRDRLSLRDRSRKRRRSEEWEWPPWGTSEEVEAVEMIATPPGIATRVKTTFSRGDEKQVLYRLSPPYENRAGDTTEYALSSALIIGGRKETLVFASDASGQRKFELVEGSVLHTLDTDQPIRSLGYTVVPAKSSSLSANRRRGFSRSV
jgi:hypothetical protein